MPSRTETRLTDVLLAAGVPDLVEILAERLSAVELVAVTREAHRRRAGRLTAAEVLAQYQRDSHFRSSSVVAATLALVERVAQSVAAPRFELLDLSPICPAGTVSVLAGVDPGAAWGAGGTCEVVSDCRSVLALESAVRRRACSDGSSVDRTVRISTGHRDLHAPFSAPLRREYHSRVFALCTAGTAEVAFGFERRALTDQVFVQLRVLETLRQQHIGIGLVTVALFQDSAMDIGDTVRDEIITALGEAFPDAHVVVDDGHRHQLGRGYCGPIGFTVSVEDEMEVEHWVGIGGFTDWTQQLLGRPEERNLVSTLAIEVLAHLA